MTDNSRELRDQILQLTEKYFEEAFRAQPFFPGQSAVPVAGKVLDAADLRNLVDASLDCWLTTGRFAAQFERQLARFLDVRGVSLVNSGSSANLLAFSALTSPKLGDRALRPGDEVITVAAGFPTTVNPIIQNRCVPVFIDITLPNYQADVSQLDAALSPRTRAIMIAHTLGNPYDLDRVAAFARQHNLWLIEDSCDALGATFKGKKVGTFGDLATISFYPAHHITMGEGGAVVTNSPLLKTLVESFRDWGRDCWCDPGKDNTCGKRFDWELGDLPCGYDHKYTYSHIGYNLKLTDMQAAIGVSQLEKLPGFIAARRRNFQHLYARPEAARRFPAAAGEYARRRPKLVWISHRRARRRALRSQSAHPRTGIQQDRHPPAVRRQPHPATRLQRCRVPRHRRSGKYRLRHAQCLLDRLSIPA